MKNMQTIISRATNFGTFESRKGIYSFMLKILFFMIPAIIIGHSIDTYIENMRKKGILGNNYINYIILQTIIILFIMYIFVIYFSRFAKEFQTTTAGAFFIAMFFGFQSNYVNDIKQFITNII